MYSNIAYIRLLLDVLPVFDSEAETYTTPGSEHWIFYVQLRTQLKILEFQLPHLNSQLKTRRRTEGKVGSLLKSLLDFFEHACKNGTQEDLSQPATHEYPLLERIREERRVPDGFKISYDLSSDKAILDQFDLWAKEVDRWIKSSTTSIAVDEDKSSKPPIIVREAASMLQKALNQAWECSSSDPHKWMMFLSTQQNVREEHTFVTFDLLLEDIHADSHNWRESQMHVILRDTVVSKVKFQIPEDSFKIPPQKREKISSLCTHIKISNQGMSLDVCLEDAQLYRSATKPSRLKSMNITPSESLERVIKGNPIISAQTKITLAVLISYTVLYLSGTPWLRSGWNKNIFFLLKAAGEHDFILKPLVASRTLQPESTESGKPEFIHKHQDLLQLGIVLLEIFLKEPIEDFREEDKDIGHLGQLDEDTNFFAADRKHADIDWDVHENYKAAVAACLRYDIPVPGPPFQGENCEAQINAYSSYIYDKIIRPLELELSILCNHQAEELDGRINEQLTQRSQALKRMLACTQRKEARETSKSGEAYLQNKSIQNSNTGHIMRRTKDLWRQSFPSSHAVSNNNSYPSFSQLFDDHDLLPSMTQQLSHRADKWLACFENTLYSSRYLDMFFLGRVDNYAANIAILDSGIDPMNRDIQRYLSNVKYHDFVAGDHEHQVDNCGHGTHVAAIVLGLAKSARVFVGRIAKGREPISPPVIAEAITYATEEWHVDIICMPFGFSNTSKEHECIQDAISKAYHRRVILVAAAANHGGLDDVAYPANQNEVICASSTDGEGNQSHFNPSPQGFNTISVLGEAVPSSWPGTGAPRKSGTSFATPIIAGAAAVVLSYIRWRKEAWTADEKYTASKARSKKGMTTIMERLMTTHRAGFQFLRPWKLFEKELKVIDELLLETLRGV